ncbi:MAG: biotin attachment protein [Flavobacteriales bacterium]|nr:biotin attachment protein [Flavobacteriales bacterium]
MLNISPDSINKDLDQKSYGSLRHVDSLTSGKVFKKLMTSFFLVGFVFMFLPWTQNIRGDGYVTTLEPDQRPQTIHSVIAGRIKKWYVKEGDFVKEGDTIVYITEIKDAYFDPQLIERTEAQLNAKSSSVESYDEKIKALERQIEIKKENRKLKMQQNINKLQQARLKYTSDSMDYNASKINYEIAQKQYDRIVTLYDQGLKSLTDTENRKNKMQEANAKMISAENKLLSSRNEVLNAKVEINATDAKFQDDISKAESELYSAQSAKFDTQTEVNKLQNQLSNYQVRSSYYYITAPQDGQITKAIQVGIGETIKEGTPLLSIMPDRSDLTVAMFIEPLDLPLVDKGEHVRIQFDGWPAIVFSGWPNTSYGTYGGEVVAIDKFISDNGMFRVLVKPDPNDHPWPDALRIGGGTNNMLLLNDVPIWYELWRQINGFPPDFYSRNSDKNQSKSVGSSDELRKSSNGKK